MVNLMLFGRTRIERDGEVRRPSPTTAVVLVRLLLAQQESVTVAELAEVARPARHGPDQRAQRTAVQQRISELRRLLDPDRPGESSRLLLTGRGRTTSYRLLVDRRQVDIFRFEDQIARAWSLRGSSRVKLSRQALSLWQDRPLLDAVGCEFAAGAIERLGQLRDAAHDLLTPASPKRIRSSR